jgi:hypothetical protein
VKTLPREPWRGGQICGWQTAYGMPWSTFCGEFKKLGSPLCDEHDRDMREDNYGALPKFAPGNALGLELRKVGDGWSAFNGWDYVAGHYATREEAEYRFGFALLWEPMDTPNDPHGETPNRPSLEELAAFEAQS